LPDSASEVNRMCVRAIWTGALLCIAGSPLTGACQCSVVPSACQALAAGSMVFIGRVESIMPPFLDRWNLDRKILLGQIIDSDDLARNAESPARLEDLKAKIREKSPQLPPDLAQRLADAKTHNGVINVLNDILGRGRVVRFRVDTLFAAGGDDDDSDDDDKTPQTIDVTTPIGDCGYDFQQGESYLVYAVRDEDTELLETGACTPTRRLSDAGSDLPLLHFYKADKKASGHLEGVVGYNSQFRAQPSDAAGKTGHPITNAVVGIRSSDFVRYAISNSQGKFVFDGLRPGDYTMEVWSQGYPDAVQLLAGPETLKVRAKSCIDHNVTVSRP
jgi:hypothetical protein